MSAFSFTVLGQPQTWKRVAGRNGASRYVEPKLRAYLAAIRTSARIACPAGWDRRSRYAVDIGVHLPTRRRADIDNYAKAVLDALHGAAYEDDSSVDELVARKHYDRTLPRVSVHITDLMRADELRDGAGASRAREENDR